MYEIERKFLIACPLADILDDARQSGHAPLSHRIEQCYLKDTGEWAIRARRHIDAYDVTRHILTLKRRHTDVTNIELESPITAEMYADIEAVCGHDPIAKLRHVLGPWEVDQFLNPQLEGLVIAEIELTCEDQPFDRPVWLGDEVTGSAGFTNAAIARRLGAAYVRA